VLHAHAWLSFQATLLRLHLCDILTASECCGQCACLAKCKAWTWSKTTKICYPKGASGWDRDNRDNIVSGTILPSTQTEIVYSKGQKIWEPKLTVGEHSLKSFGEDISSNSRADNKYVVKDPTCNSTQPVVRAMYHEVCIYFEIYWILYFGLCLMESALNNGLTLQIYRAAGPLAKEMVEVFFFSLGLRVKARHLEIQ